MPATKLIIVTEGLSDVRILRSILYKELHESMRFFAAQGRETLTTLGRNLLVHEGGPVLLVMDVATSELPIRDEKVAEMLRAMSTIGAPGLFDVFVFTPEIEAVFFEAPAALQRATGIEVPEALITEGMGHPKTMLGRFLAQAKIPNIEVLIRKMDDTALEALSRGNQATALRERVRVFNRADSLAGA
jgi:hypothetical protein